MKTSPIENKLLQLLQDVTIRASAGLTDYGKYDRVYKTVEGGAGYME